MKLLSQIRLITAALAVCFTVVPLWAQQPEQAPLGATAEIGVGYSNVLDQHFSQSGAITSAQSDVNGFWRDPRILLFDFAPYATLGNSLANGMEFGNRGKGFSSSTTFLGGSIAPLTVNYTRGWQDIPTFTSNPLSGLSTSFADDTLSIDTGFYWRKAPPLSFHFGSGGTSTEYTGGIGNADTSYKSYGLSTNYTLWGWALTGTYTANNLNAHRINFDNLTGAAQPETTASRDLHFEASNDSLRLPLTFVGGKRKWNDDAPGYQKIDSDYFYGRMYGNVRPFSRLNINFNSGYDSDESAYLIQQAVGGQGSPSPLTPTLPGLSSGSTVVGGGGAQLTLPAGISVNADSSLSHFSGTQGLGGQTMLWDASLNYMRKTGGSGMIVTSFGYQHSQTDGASITGRTGSTFLRVGGARYVPYSIYLSGNLHYAQREVESVSTSLGRVSSPGKDYGVALSASRKVAGRLKLSGDFDYTNGHTDYPVYFQTKMRSIGVRADSGGWNLSMHRTYQKGLAMQLGSSWVYVGDPQQAVLTPLNTLLATHSTVQTILTGAYQPGSKRFRVSASYIRFGFDNRGVHATDAGIYNVTVGYRLRSLRLQAGFYRSTSQAYAIRNSSPLLRRQIYFEVIRHFNLF